MRKPSHRLPLRAALAGAAAALAAALAGAAPASDYVALGRGDTASYRNGPGGDEAVVAVDRANRRWRHYTDFAGLGALWVLSHPGRGGVYVRRVATEPPRLLADFDAPVGTRFGVAAAPCQGAVTLAARGQRVTTPAGTFEDTVLLHFDARCPGAVARAWFARGVGVVRYERVAGGFVQSYSLVSASIGQLRLDEGSGLDVSASFPGHVVDETETRELATVCRPAGPGAPPSCETALVPTRVSVSLTARNLGPHDLEWQTATTQLFEITIFDGIGRTVSLWSRGRRHAARVTDRLIRAGDALTVKGFVELADELGRPLPPGPYTIAIEIFGIDVSASSPLDVVGVEPPEPATGPPPPAAAPGESDTESVQPGVILGRR